MRLSFKAEALEKPPRVLVLGVTLGKNSVNAVLKSVLDYRAAAFFSVTIPPEILVEHKPDFAGIEVALSEVDVANHFVVFLQLHRNHLVGFDAPLEVFARFFRGHRLVRLKFHNLRIGQVLEQIIKIALGVAAQNKSLGFGNHFSSFQNTRQRFSGAR